MLKKGTIENKAATPPENKAAEKRKEGGKLPMPQEGGKSSKNEDKGQKKKSGDPGPDGVLFHLLRSETREFSKKDVDLLGISTLGDAEIKSWEGNAEVTRFVMAGEVFAVTGPAKIKATEVFVMESPTDSILSNFVSPTISDAGEPCIVHAPERDFRFGHEKIFQNDALRVDMVYMPIGALNVDICDILRACIREGDYTPLIGVCLSGTPIGIESETSGSNPYYITRGKLISLILNGKPMNWKLSAAHSDARIVVFSKK